jgi:asparagine synthase (glutamine-hydrolysing)
MLGVRPTATLWNLIHPTEFSHREAELAARAGASVMMTGEGGDQAFYQVRAVFAAADYLRWRGPRSQWLTAALDAARMDRQSLWHVMSQAMLAQLPGRMWSPEEEIGRFRTLMTPDALAAVRRGGLALHPWFRNPRGATSGMRWHAAMMMIDRPFYDLLQPDANLPDVITPLTSQPVVEVCLRIPPYLHIYTGWDRAIARLAFEDELPEEIITRRAKGTFEEHFAQVRRHNLAFVRELLIDGALVRQGLVDRRRLSDALSNDVSTVRSGNLEVLDCLSAEAWLRSWNRGNHRNRVPESGAGISAAGYASAR